MPFLSRSFRGGYEKKDGTPINTKWRAAFDGPPQRRMEVVPDGSLRGDQNLIFDQIHVLYEPGQRDFLAHQGGQLDRIAVRVSSPDCAGKSGNRG